MTMDTLIVAFIYLCIPWVILEAASQFSSNRLVRVRKRLTTKDTGNTWVSRGPLWIKVETTNLNNLPSVFLSHLERLFPNRSKRKRLSDSGINGHGQMNGDRTHLYEETDGRMQVQRQFHHGLELFYDAGTIFAGIAMLGSIVFLIWGAFDLIGQISQLSGPDTSQPKLQKRGFEGPAEEGMKEQGWSPSLVPLIPGLTLPLSHIYPLVLALSATQIIHEAGHAICGVLQSWIPLRMGLIILFPCIPGAFVVLPHEAVNSVDDDDDVNYNSDTVGREPQDLTRKRLRNISAGVWHNAISALLLGLLIWTGAGRAMHHVLWREVEGMRVESVDPSSPLLHHIPTGTIISTLDDFNLTTRSQRLRKPTEIQALWDEYLLGDKGQEQKQMGWCVPQNSWDGQSAQCCDVLHGLTPSQEANQDMLCFQPLSDAPALTGRCFDPIRLISGKSQGQRCSGECSQDQVCVVADAREQLIRISIVRAQEDSSRVVLFQGSSRSIHSALTISPYVFRLAWIGLPYHIFQWWNLLISYLLNLSLAMALLNMLPLPSLDGDVFLRFILEALVSRFHLPDTYTNAEDLEDEEEVLSSFELGARVTSRPDSPTQLRRSAMNRSSSTRRLSDSCPAFTSQRQMANARVLARIQERFRWFTIFLAVFVFGGSILLHAAKGA